MIFTGSILAPENFYEEQNIQNPMLVIENQFIFRRISFKCRPLHFSACRTTFVQRACPMISAKTSLSQLLSDIRDPSPLLLCFRLNSTDRVQLEVYSSRNREDSCSNSRRGHPNISLLGFPFSSIIQIPG